MTDITAILVRNREGDPAALNDLFDCVYRQMRVLARRIRRPGSPPTLGTTALIHEAYLKLAESDSLSLQDRSHFFRTAAMAMRQILINAIEARQSQKRGAGVEHFELQDDLLGTIEDPQSTLDLAKAVDRLRQIDARLAEIVELRYFAGFTSEECAEVLGMSVPTVQRDWRLAKGWLHRELADPD